MPSRRYGYSCRPWIKGYVEEECSDTVRLWFCLREDASGNVDSSNPRHLYDQWQRIVAQEDHGHRYVKDLCRDLGGLAGREIGEASIRQKLRLQIAALPIGYFRPERLRLDLSWIARARHCTVDRLLHDCKNLAEAEFIGNKPGRRQKLQPDEYLIDSLPLAEFTSWCTLY